MTKRSSKKQLEFDFSSDEEKPKQQWPTRQANHAFDGTKEQARAMLLTALHKELTSKATKFIKPTMQPNQKNRILRNIQDEDIDFEKLCAQAARAFSVTWVKQIAPGKLEYKPQIPSKYATNIPVSTTTVKTTPSPLSGRKPPTTIQQEESDESESENLLEEEEFDKTPASTQTPTRSNTSAEKKMPAIKPPPPFTQPDNLKIDENKPIDQEDSSFSYASVTRELEQAGQILDEATTTTWKQELETKLQNQIYTTITTVKEEILETISTTKGELLTHLDTLRADITAQDTKLDQRTKNAKTIYLKLQQQQADMEKLSQTIQQQQNSLHEYYTAFQQQTNAEKKQIQTTQEEARQSFRNNVKQASRHYLVHHERKSEAIMTNARTRQTETYRQECRTIQNEYKKKIAEKYDALEAESMQFADQAILELDDLLHQEKKNILDEIKQDIPNKIMHNIQQDITATLETTITKHMDAIKEQRKTTITQIQKTAKRHTEQMEYERDNMKEEYHNDVTEVIKTKASIAFSLDLQSQVQQQLRDFDHHIASKTIPGTPPAQQQQRMNHVPSTSQYWTKTTNQTTMPSPACPNPETTTQQPMDRFKLARSKELEAKLPIFRKDQMFIHLPNEPLQHYMEAFFETLATMMNNYDFPIVLQDLAPRGSTCPTEPMRHMNAKLLWK